MMSIITIQDKFIRFTSQIPKHAVWNAQSICINDRVFPVLILKLNNKILIKSANEFNQVGETRISDEILFGPCDKNTQIFNITAAIVC